MGDEVGESRRPWTQEEDDLIVKLVKEHGLRKWAIVAAQLSGRSGKQCRERYKNQVGPCSLPPYSPPSIPSWDPTRGRRQLRVGRWGRAGSHRSSTLGREMRLRHQT